ncbi:MAG: hypothetical protein Q4A82_03610 [Corynebacterium sp.]|nr:hypothetical protein [Corynebacterium sp.]
MALIFSITYFWLTAVLVVLSGVALPAMNSAITSYTLAVSDEAHVGKVFTASGVPGMILSPVGMWLAGFTLEQFGFTPTMAWVIAASAVACALSILSPALRAMPKLSEMEASTSE